MHPPTRLRILDYLRKQQTASVRELSRLFLLTGANIRHHLGVLESNALVEVIGQSHAGRGRPKNIYALSRQVLGDGLDGLARATLDAWLRNSTEAELEIGLRSVAMQLAGQTLPGNEIQLKRRLTSLVDRLNELHYQSRWEAGAKGPNVILGHCPYSAILASNPELCRMDEFLLEEWTQLPVEQTARQKKGIRGYPFCSFRIIVNL
jgi:predicted ArsR family transcriptional regulator